MLYYRCTYAGAVLLGWLTRPIPVDWWVALGGHFGALAHRFDREHVRPLVERDPCVTRHVAKFEIVESPEGLLDRRDQLFVGLGFPALGEQGCRGHIDPVNDPPNDKGPARAVPHATQREDR